MDATRTKGLSLRRRRQIAFFLMALGMVALVIGIWRGEMRVVLMKAVNICLECIGIG